MSAAEALRAAHAAGVAVMLDGASLVLEANAEPPQAVLDMLSCHKLAILDLLRPGRDGWTAEQWRAYFDKRTGIAASNSGLPRAEADALALACCVIEWMNRNPAPSRRDAAHGAAKGNPPAQRCSHSEPSRRRMHGYTQVQEALHRDPHAGDLYVFRGARGNLIKIIWHDGQGACLFTKRLERGRFLWPSMTDGVVTISAAQLSYLLSGIDWRMPQETWRPQAAG